MRRRCTCAHALARHCAALLAAQVAPYNDDALPRLLAILTPLALSVSLSPPCFYTALDVRLCACVCPCACVCVRAGVDSR